MPYMRRVEGDATMQDGGAVETTFQINDRVDSESVGGLSRLFSTLNHLKATAVTPLILDFGVTRSGLE